MNKSILTLLLLAVLPGCSGSAPQSPPLEGARMGGAFTLTNQDGKRVSDTDFKGKYRLVYFGYTFCPDVCPVDVQKLMAGFRQFELEAPAAAAKTVPMFITVDPERDTPPVLKQFVSAFHPRLIGLTGTPADIAAVAKLYGVVYEKESSANPKAYLVDHSRTAVLYGPDGAPITLIPQDGTPQAIAAEFERWVK